MCGGGGGGGVNKNSICQTSPLTMFPYSVHTDVKLSTVETENVNYI